MSKMYVYLIRSRNKDNKDIPNFKERAKSLVLYEEDESRAYEEFHKFVVQGLPGEKIRLYKSVNARDEEKCRKGLIIRLLNGASLTNMRNTLASVCQQIENRAESKWLFDFDCEDTEVLSNFIEDIERQDVKTEVHKTPNGYAIIAEHGFDTRELLNKYKEYDITLKKDELLFLGITENIKEK